MVHAAIAVGGVNCDCLAIGLSEHCAVTYNSMRFSDRSKRSRHTNVSSPLVFINLEYEIVRSVTDRPGATRTSESYLFPLRLTRCKRGQNSKTLTSIKRLKPRWISCRFFKRSMPWTFEMRLNEMSRVMIVAGIVDGIVSISLFDKSIVSAVSKTRSVRSICAVAKPRP